MLSEVNPFASEWIGEVEASLGLYIMAKICFVENRERGENSLVRPL
jgi:hypothetical protein